MRARAGFALYWLALWLAQVLPARLITDDLPDPSWSRALGHFLAQGLRIGEDYVFTYGPLGYFSTLVDEPALYWHKLILWEIGWRLLASWFLARVLWDGRSHWARGVALALVLAIPLVFDAFAFAVIFAVASVLAREERPAAAVRALGFLLLSSLALVKFTFAIASGATAAALVLHALARGGRKAALQDAGAALAGLCLCWFAAGQGLANFLPWLQRSLAIAAAYGEGQSKPCGAFSAVIGALTLLGIAVLLVRGARGRAALAIALLLSSFCAFKAGYVRGDDHTSYYLGFALLACWLLPGERLAILPAAGCSLLALLGIFGAPEREGERKGALALEFVARLPDNAADVLNPWRARARLDEAQRLRAARFDLPRIRERVGREALDVFNFHQGVALLNGLEYRPRPLFQSYVASTPELQELDVRHYEGPHAPRFVLFRLTTIDDRLPTMEQSRLLETLLRLYQPVLSERRELLLERRVEALPPVRRTLELERELGFGEELELPATNAPARLLTLDIRRRALGAAAQFLYRAPEIHLVSRDEFGNRRSLRVVPGMMRTGVLIDPFVAAGDGWVQFLVGARQMRLRSIQLEIESGWEWMYEARFGLRLEGAEGLAPPRDDELSRELDAFVFERMPEGLQVAQPALRLETAGKDCFYVFAPSAMAWSVGQGRHKLEALFGLSTDPRRLPSSTRVCFQVGLIEGGQQKLLMERWIDLAKLEDQSFQKLAMEFDVASGGQLVLQTALAPDDRTRNAWCFWSDVTIR